MIISTGEMEKGDESWPTLVKPISWNYSAEKLKSFNETKWLTAPTIHGLFVKGNIVGTEYWMKALIYWLCSWSDFTI